MLVPLLLLALASPPRADTLRVTTLDTTFYVTNRERRDGRLQRILGDSLEFGVVVTRFTELRSTASSARLLARLAAAQVDSVQLQRAEFASRLHVADSAAGAHGDGTIIYVHGFATSFGRGVAQGAEIAHRGRIGGPMVVFSWPARRAFASWPSLGALVSRGYREDSVSAVQSEAAFRAALFVVRSAVRSGALTLVSHSLGAQLAGEALMPRSAIRDSLVAAPLRALVFFAPDIAAARFRDSLSLGLAPLAARRIVYASSSDRLLKLSHLLNHAWRAGQLSGARELAATGMEVVDVTRGLVAIGGLRKFVDTHHAMRYAATALFDFYGVARGVPAACRTAGGIVERDGDRLWRLTGKPIPDHLASCPAAAVADGSRESPPPGRTLPH